LWETALPEFKSVVLRHFHKEIFGDLEYDPDFPKSKQKSYLQAPRDHIAFSVDRLQQKVLPLFHALFLVKLAISFLLFVTDIGNLGKIALQPLKITP